MRNAVCPRCGSAHTMQQTVHDRFKAWDPAGEVFEVTVLEPIWICPVCNMSWEGHDGLAAKENAYQTALQKRHPDPRT